MWASLKNRHAPLAVTLLRAIQQLAGRVGGIHCSTDQTLFDIPTGVRIDDKLDWWHVAFVEDASVQYHSFTCRTGLYFICKCAACESRAWIANWSPREGIFMEAALVIPDFQLFISEGEEVQGREEWGEAPSELREFYYAVVCMHQGSQVSLCLDKWFCMQYDRQGALLRAGCIVLWSNLVVLSPHHGCNAPLSPSLVLPPTSPVAPFIPPDFSPLTLSLLTSFLAGQPANDLAD